jgi:hypothetical protein
MAARLGLESATTRRRLLSLLPSRVLLETAKLVDLLSTRGVVMDFAAVEATSAVPVQTFVVRRTGVRASGDVATKCAAWTGMEDDDGWVPSETANDKYCGSTIR